MIKAIAMSIVCLLVGNLPLQLFAQEPDHPKPKAHPPLQTQCTLTRDIGLDQKPLQPGDLSIKSNGSCDFLGGAKEKLVGTGDILIAIENINFEEVSKAQIGKKGNFVLFLNGIAFTQDASLIASEVVNQLRLLRYRIRQGDETQKLWSILYADGALIKPVPLHASLGWLPSTQGEPAIIPERPETTTAEISLTSPFRFTVALILVGLTFFVTIYIGSRTDALRDRPDSEIPEWWQSAKELQNKMAGITDNTKREEQLIKLFQEHYKTDQKSYYEKLARLAIRGELVKSELIEDTKIGLAMSSTDWKPRRASYSLSRTQLALWFTFAVATSVFLWIVYGDLRAISGSLLVLLGISGGTAGVSWLTDHDRDNVRPYTPSQGFFADILTGFDDRKQVHRYQAVVVNVFLLVVGAYYVYRHLSPPEFDPTWLIFLGVSGVAYGVGKQTLETKKI